MQINWDSFKVYNQDSQGIRYKFEDLCRHLFVNENLSGNREFRYLHANPNNRGLETDPIFDELNGRWIGFQAKYFDDVVGNKGYKHIKESAEKIVKYYTGQLGTVELVYLFCNKPITASAKGYVETVELLKNAGIELQLITDATILDLVRNKYPYLANYYFGNLTLLPEWFKTQAKYMYDVLGDRYNRQFNVETKASEEIALFLHDKRAVQYINDKKSRLVEEIELHYDSGNNKNYLRTLKETVLSLEDVDEESLFAAEDWIETLMEAVEVFLCNFKETRCDLKAKCDELYKVINAQGKTKTEIDETIKEYDGLREKIYEIDIMINLPQRISLSEREINNLHGDILLIDGVAGIGKSQLLANSTKSLLEENRSALLLVSGIYYTDKPIKEQIMDNLGLNHSFEDMIDALEVVGEKENRIVPVFIDALNETWNKNLWKNGLPHIIDIVKHAPMVRLIMSYRSEYAKIILPDYVYNENENREIIELHHNGFADNSIEAIRKFMDFHGILFTPLEYFGYEMSNPLFLTLYCKTYNGDEVSLPTLYNRVIKKANDNIYHQKEQMFRDNGYEYDRDIINPLIEELAEYMSEHDKRSIVKDDFSKLKYWSESGLSIRVMIPAIVKENILYESFVGGKEQYYFAYDQMIDYFCAKAIVAKYKTKEEIRSYLAKNILAITEDGDVKKSWNIDIYINVCALYADLFDEECIDIVDAVTDVFNRREIIERYIDSFQWRDSRHVSKNSMLEFLTKYQCSKEMLWSMLIGNSVKVNNPLNADFLHGILMNYTLNQRDFLWTTYINTLTTNDSNRIIQLVQMYDKGEKLEAKNDKQIELLLTLFGWLLTSSNRWLRDYTSKAMIEILKEHFNLCVQLLEKYKNVNDPYVLQRLYGVVFGAYTKCGDKDGQDVAEYVYCQIFNQEKVYPDILLRDYARLIIEKFLYDNPSYQGVINYNNIIPPYKSDPIPQIEDQHYKEKKYDGASFWLIHSMTFEGMGVYGDFGRYVFQSALHSFDIDDEEMFNYAIYYIFNELGFQNDLFDEHDRHCGDYNYNRHHTAKTERIGKKYQWITMYNMLARISDNCRMIDNWNYPPDEDVSYEGAWNPYVRDFDPTLNENFMNCDEAPNFSCLDEFLLRAQQVNKLSDTSSEEKKKSWLDEKGVLLEELKDTMILTDDIGHEWVCLTRYCDTGRSYPDVDTHFVWCWQYAYFGTLQQANELSVCIDKGVSIRTSSLTSCHESYAIFNREYPWSPSCNDFEKDAWVDVSIETSEYEVITDKVLAPDFEWDSSLLKCYLGDESEKVEPSKEDIQTEGSINIQFKEETIKRRIAIEKNIGRLLHSTTDILWEEEYDATKNEPITYSVPCKELIDVMELRQLEWDGFFFDRDKKLASFDTMLTQDVRSVVVRKDILDEFLLKTGMCLIWIINSDKEIHNVDNSICDGSHWEGVLNYDGDSIVGEVRRIGEKT